MRKFREYEPEDFQNMAFMDLDPTEKVSAGYRDQQGRIKLGVETLKNEADFAFASDEGWYVVPSKTKRLLETSGLKGIQFRPTAPTLGGGYGEPTVWGPDEEWWELTSDISMPPLSPRLARTDSLGRVITSSDDSQGFIPREGLFAPVELRYTATAITALPPFDLAKTYERMGNVPALDHRLLIVSRKFYDFCRQHGLKTGWIPVRIDSDVSGAFAK